jgi:hypothetical protein
MSAVAYVPDELAAAEEEWVSAIVDLEDSCAAFCDRAEYRGSMTAVDHLEQVRFGLDELISAALRLERISERLAEHYAEL